MEFFATASSGTEKALQAELLELGFQSVRLNSGGIPFLGNIEEGWRACLHSRIAQRIQLVLTRFNAPTEIDLYEGVKSIDWTPFITPEHTLSVSAFCHSSNLTHTGYIALKVKDAIVDQLREKHGSRPNVDRDDPDVRVFVFIGSNKATVYLDMSGKPLFQRGYRLEKGEAPLKETLAAAMLKYSGWDRKTPLWDPMCGSGTIAIEAGLWARNIPPGIFRDKFGFERWANFDDKCADAMRLMRGEGRRNANNNMPKLIASDCNPEVLETAKANAKRAGLKITFREASIEDIQADGARRFVVTNPPFNERLGVDMDFYRKLGAAFSRLHGCRIAFICSNTAPMQSIPLRETELIEMKNGDLDCGFAIYDIP
jgi:putative N6-adenine-specific DNA methylase